MSKAFSRTQMLLGAAAMDKLAGASVAVFGIGGVGSFAAEALARSGVGRIVLFDNDKICETNINRQLIATCATVGEDKVAVMQRRIHDINPECEVNAHVCFYTAQNADEYDLGQYNYIIDAIDTVSSKLVLIERAKAADVPIVSSMGAGNKLDPTQFEVADIYATSVCPLAKVMRRELRQRGIDALKVVYSREQPLKPLEDDETGCKNNCVCPPGSSANCLMRRAVPGSVAFVPSVAGLILAGEVIKDLMQ